METEPKMETKTEPEMGAGTETETKTETEMEMETKTPLLETETEAKTETEVETEMRNERTLVSQLPLPQFIVIGGGSMKVVFGGPLYSIGWVADSVFNPRAKIEVERAKSNPNYYHLRFCHSNRYWHQNPAGDAIFALATEPEEDLSNHMCTLFSFRQTSTVATGGAPKFAPIHVQSGKTVRGHGSRYLQLSYVGDVSHFDITDWSTLVTLPPRVAFKGYNDKYLKAVIQDRNNYHKFESDDPNEKECGYEVFNTNDGHVRIRSDHWGMFWRRNSNWIWGDASANATTNRDTLFWPVMVNKENMTIGLRNAGNNMFCMALSADRKTDCLSAAASTTTNPARLVVEELVSDRKVYNITYRMEHSRIFNETPFLAGSSRVTNHTDQEASMGVEIEYTSTTTNSFSNSITLTAGMSNTFEGGIPWIFSGRIEVYMEGSYTREWGQSISTSETIKATGSVVVPPRTTALVSYVGARGTCNVPFSYTQQDRSSTTGQVTNDEKIDGIYEGVNSYDFQFVITSTRSLDLAK